MTHEMDGGGLEHGFADFLAPGITPEDLPALFPLLSAKNLIGSFTALFHGGPEAVMVRLLVLREISLRADAPYWSPRELEAHFGYLDPVKLDTVLKRLRDYDLLVWDGERRTYGLSPAGRMALTALEHLFRFSEEADAEIGFITSQIAAGAAVGRLAPELLRHLLARLAELEDDFSTAVQSGSEFRLKRAQEKLTSVWHWMEKGTQVIKGLGEAGLLDDASWRLAQEIGARQSRIMRMTGVFQREISAIARQRVHLSQGGITSSELAGWLRTRSVTQLCALAAGACRIVPVTAFVLSDVMLDVAEYELTERSREAVKATPMPPPADAEVTAEFAPAPPPELPQLTALLSRIEAPISVADAIVGGSYRAAAYRFSLLPLMGEKTAAPDLAAFAGLAVRLVWTDDDAMAPVGRDEVASINTGNLLPDTKNG